MRAKSDDFRFLTDNLLNIAYLSTQHRCDLLFHLVAQQFNRTITAIDIDHGGDFNERSSQLVLCVIQLLSCSDDVPIVEIFLLSQFHLQVIVFRRVENFIVTIENGTKFYAFEMCSI